MIFLSEQLPATKLQARDRPRGSPLAVEVRPPALQPSPSTSPHQHCQPQRHVNNNNNNNNNNNYTLRVFLCSIVFEDFFRIGVCKFFFCLAEVKKFGLLWELNLCGLFVRRVFLCFFFSFVEPTFCQLTTKFAPLGFLLFSLSLSFFLFFFGRQLEFIVLFCWRIWQEWEHWSSGGFLEISPRFLFVFVCEEREREKERERRGERKEERRPQTNRGANTAMIAPR